MGGTKHITMRMPEELVGAIDRRAVRDQRSRSQVAVLVLEKEFGDAKDSRVERAESLSRPKPQPADALVPDSGDLRARVSVLRKKADGGDRSRADNVESVSVVQSRPSHAAGCKCLMCKGRV